MTEAAEKPDFADTLEAQLIAEYVGDGQTIAETARLLEIRRGAIYEHMNESTRFRDMMESARERGYDAIAEECVRIAEDGTNDYRSTIFGIKLDKEHVQRSKLRVETRLKLLAKWHPKKYGEKLQVEQRSASIAIPASDDPIEAQRAYEELMKGG